MFANDILRPDEFVMYLLPPDPRVRAHSRYPLDNYKMTEREAQPEEDNSVPGRISRLELQYKESGLRRSVDAVMVVQVRGFPHVLVLQVANAFYKLPGGYLDPSETDAAGLITRLDEQLGIPKEYEGLGNLYHKGGNHSWYVKDCLSVWWRPNFDTFFYPYLPPHVSEPKEIKKLYLVELPPNKTFAVPANMKLLAIPLMEFYDNAARYGPQFAGLPYVLGMYWLPAHQKAADLAMEHTDFEHHF